MTLALRPLIQPFLAAVAIAGLTLWPPAAGPMLLVPLAGGQAEAANVALAAGARLLGAGPLERSIVVTGRRARLARGAWRHAVLVLAAPAFLCGGRP